MRNLITLLSLAVIMTFCIDNISLAQGCEEGKEMLDRALTNVPDEMTEEYIQMALQQCEEKLDLYHRIAKYYKQWYKTEPNSEKQAKFKKLAEHYYRKAIASGKGRRSQAMKNELAKLESNREFNKAAFRALRPASPGSTGSGLHLQVNFELDSYALSNDVQAHLYQLGEILVEKRSIQISLEGHTDITGTAQYNKKLSLKRAESVRDYLVKKFNIASDRILTSGYGYERLAEKSNPYSGKNRRVEVIKLSE
jgi:outer membrane protein OmpA-like peptidoglycan-associated protein